MIEIDYGDIMTAHMNNYAGLPVKYIVAGNYNEYQAYVKRKPRIEYYYKYVSSVDTIRGLSEINGAFIGTYDQRPDIEDIKDTIAVIKTKQLNREYTNSFNWTNKPAVGFVAQEIDHIIPEAVLKELDDSETILTKDFFRAINGGDIDSYINGRLNEV
jgi:hypothetical protein